MRLPTSSTEMQEDALYHAAYCLYQLGRYDEALSQYTIFTTRYPKSQHIAASPQYTFGIGKLYFGQEQYKEALSNYQSALQNAKKQSLKTEIHLAMAEAHFAIGKVYFGKEDYGNALSTYQLALQNTEKQPLKTEIHLAIAETHFAIGKVYFRKKDHENALASYQSALQNMAIGHAHYNQGNHKNAIVAHTSLLETYPESDFIIEAKLGIANSHFRMRAWREAAKAYARVINEHPEAAKFTPYCAYQVGEAHYGLATDHNEQSKIELVVDNLHKALEWYQKIIDDFLNDKGEVIGVVYAVHGGPDAQNLNLAIPVNYLKALLKRVGPLIPLSAR